MSSHVFGNLDVTSEIVERRLELWNTLRKAKHETEEKAPSAGFRFLTIARDLGCLGDAIAQEVARRLKWQVFDHEIVSYIAKNSNVRESLVGQLDEKSQGMIQDMISRYLEMPEYRPFGSADYYESLIETLACLARHGSAILIGRGAAFALGEDRHGLNIRLTASLEVRMRRLSEVWKVPVDEARRRIRTDDEERRRFIRQYYRHDFEDMRFFDIVFNTDRASAEQIALSIIGYLNQSAP